MTRLTVKPPVQSSCLLRSSLYPGGGSNLRDSFDANPGLFRLRILFDACLGGSRPSVTAFDVSPASAPADGRRGYPTFPSVDLT
jgi:hypothetical protein